MSSRQSRRIAVGERAAVSLVVAAAASLVAVFFVLLACVAGTSALAEDSEGLRPMLAVFATLALAVAAFMTAVMARAVAGAAPPVLRRLLWISASLGVLTVVYVFAAAAPGGPAFHDSWGELGAAVLGLWIGLAALSLVDERVLWRFVAGAGGTLLFASVVIAAR